MFIYNMVMGALIYAGWDEQPVPQTVELSLESEVVDGDNELDSI